MCVDLVVWDDPVFQFVVDALQCSVLQSALPVSFGENPPVDLSRAEPRFCSFAQVCEGDEVDGAPCAGADDESDFAG